MSITTGSGGPFVAPPGPTPNQQGAQGQATRKVTPFTSALVNGTPVLVTVPVPNDGQKHAVTVVGQVDATVSMTGGAVQAQWTGNGSALNTNISNGGFVAPNHVPFVYASGQSGIMADPGTNVVIQQLTALTGGTASITGLVIID